jgi:hypothetical protein
MNNPEVINIEDIYYKHDEEDRKLLGENTNCCYRFLERFFCNIFSFFS